MPATFSSLSSSRSAVGSMPVRSGRIQPPWSKWPRGLPCILSILTAVAGLLRSLNMLLALSPTSGRAQSTARAGRRHHTYLPSHRIPTPSKANTSPHRRTAKSACIWKSVLLCLLCFLPGTPPVPPSQHHQLSAFLVIMLTSPSSLFTLLCFDSTLEVMLTSFQSLSVSDFC